LPENAEKIANLLKLLQFLYSIKRKQMIIGKINGIK